MNKDSIIKTINNEKLDTNELAELFWLLNKDQYKERPVTIEEFYSSKEFSFEKSTILRIKQYYGSKEIYLDLSKLDKDSFADIVVDKEKIYEDEEYEI